jgi:hypothetical protein
MDKSLPGDQASWWKFGRREAFEFILESTQPVVAVSVIPRMFEDLREAKAAGMDADKFARVLFVFLHDSDPEHRAEMLSRPNASGRLRKPNDNLGTIEWDPTICALCRPFADVEIDTAKMNHEDEIVERVRGLLEAERTRAG